MRKLKRALSIVTAVCVIAGNVMMDPVPLYAAENSDVQIEQDTDYQESGEDTSQESIGQNTEESQEPVEQSIEEDQEPIEQNTEEDQESIEQNAEEDQGSLEQNAENGQEAADQENIQQNEETPEAEANSVQEDIQEEEQTDTPQNDGAEVQPEETADSEAAEEEAVSEENPDADPTAENSWRYSNGNLIEQPSTYSRAATYPYAWEKVNGKFMSSNGTPIPGATKKGIDVSVHNGKIDWQKVKNDGIDFAIIRCGYGQNMTSQDDAYWEYNVSECERLGIPYGVYLYSYANTLAKAKSEAQHVLRLLKGHEPAYPVYYDLEDTITLNLSNSMKKQIATTFCNAVSAAGYEVGIYSSLDWWRNYLTDPIYDSWSRWIAQWNSTCSYTGDYDMWQCSATGRVDGISTNVDLNFWIEDENTGSSSGSPNTSKPSGDSTSGSTSGSSGSSSSGNSSSGSTSSTADGKVIYSTHVQTYGWQAEVDDGSVSGTTGKAKRLEGIKIKLGSGITGGIQYSTHVQTYGWQGYVSNGALSGTTGEGKRLEAIRIKLTGEASEKYDVYYSVHAQTYGWMGWAKNGEAAGTSGYGKRLEAIRIVLVAKAGKAPGSTANAYVEKGLSVEYRTHVQTFGWQGYVSNGATSGTTGQAKRLEGIQIQLSGQSYSGNIEYSTHVQTYGWQGYVSNGATSGTTGQAKRLEAIRIRLTGEMSKKYDIYYRVHSQTFGWMGWAKNGAAAGTSGYAKRLEGIQIKIVPKGSSAPGSTQNSYYAK